MLAVFLVALGAIAIVSLSLLVMLYRWLTTGWQVVSDDELHEREGFNAALWTSLGWLRPGRRQLTYRRDERGRFRRYRR